MGIEYLAGFKPGDVIDLSRFEKKSSQRFSSSENGLNFDKEKRFKLEDYLPRLKDGLKELAKETNEYFPDFLETDGRIAIVGPEAEADLTLVSSQEDGFSRDFQGRKPEDLNVWREENEKKSPKFNRNCFDLIT
jgi:hypothetical protein